MKREWWHSLTVYQIYTRSFCDSNGDGIGDFGGILQKLDYLQELGVGAIWLSPFNDSPNYDNGYDVSDYYKVMEEAGTMEELEELIAACEKREIVVMMDLVLNHSSHLHPWFLEARKDRNSKYHDFYIWKEGTKEQPPEGGGAFFGGSTWEWVPEVQEYYYHSFSVMQPDLNWKNPSLRKELYRMIQFWMDKGIRGFRLDAIDNIVKDGHGGNDTHSEQIHTYLMEMNQNTYGKSEQILTVGETGGATVEMAQQYSDPESQELSMIFQFELMGIDGIRSGNWDPKPYTLPQLKQLFEKWQTGLEEKGWNSLFWGNHDFPRVVSRFGNDREPYREKSAKMLAVLLHGMKGTPYIYQGEEIGMTNVSGLRIEDYQDITCYTKAGMTDDSYVVYVTYDVKFRRVDTLGGRKNSYLSCTEQPGPCADANAVECGKTRRIYSGNTVDGGKSELRGDQCGKQQKKSGFPLLFLSKTNCAA